MRLSNEFKGQLISGEMTLDQMADLLSHSWRLKRSLAPTVTSTELDTVYEACLRAGALGGKLLGAGGGGFLLMCVRAQDRESFLCDVGALVAVPVLLESQGSRMLSTVST